MEKKEKAPVLRFKDTNGKDYPAWEQRELNTAATFLNGRAFSQSELLSKGKYPVLRVGNFYTNDKWYFSDLVLPEKFYANKGDLLYTWSATFGPHIWEGDKVIYHYHIWKLLPGKDTDKAFLLSLLQRDRETLLQGSNGSTMIHITKQAMEAKKLFFPRSQKEQRQIGIFFKTIDKAITLHQRKLEALKKLKRTLLQKMFPKKGHLKPELRFFGFTNDWEQRKLGDIGTVQMNKRIFKTQTSTSGEIPFYKIGTFGKIPDAYISRELFEEYKKKYPYPKKGDLLLSASGSIGNVVEYNGEEAYFQDSNIVWLEHGKTISNFFLKAFYSVVNWEGIEGTTIKRLYNKTILDTPITLPSFEEQEKIGNFFTVLDKVITLHQRKLEIYKKLKKGLLQKMFI